MTGLDQNTLKQITSFLIQKLFPSAKILSTPNGTEPVCQLIQTGPLLIEFQFYAKELGEEAFETLLKTAAALEVKRKEQQNPSLLDIGVCVLAQGFSREFLARLPASLVRVDIFAWEFIRSEEDKAVLIRPIRSGIIPERGSVMFSEEVSSFSTKPLTRQQTSKSELSTPELVAFARLGMELRNRKAQSSAMSGQ